MTGASDDEFVVACDLSDVDCAELEYLNLAFERTLFEVGVR